MLKKIISFALLCALLIPTLASCGKRVEKRIEKADEYISASPYMISVSTNFVAADGVATIFAEIGTSKTKVYFHGANYHAQNESLIDTGDDVYYFKTAYTSINGTLYKDMSYSKNDEPIGETYSRASITSGQSKQLANYLSLVGGVDVNGFADSQELDHGRKAVTVRYSNASDDVKAALVEMMHWVSERVFDDVTVNSATLTLSVKDNKYSAAIVECSYEVTIGEVSYPVTACVTMDFDYNETFGIYHPNNAGEYEVISVDNLLPF